MDEDRVRNRQLTPQERERLFTPLMAEVLGLLRTTISGCIVINWKTAFRVGAIFAIPIFVFAVLAEMHSGLFWPVMSASAKLESPLVVVALAGTMLWVVGALYGLDDVVWPIAVRPDELSMEFVVAT